MKSLIKNALICSSLLLALTACSKEEKEQIRITATQQMDSQQLADAGEQLMMPQSLHLAHKVFDMALSKDPENKKAQFYQAFLERFMIFEGVLTRVQPYVDKYADPVSYAKTLKDLPKHSMRNFLLNPQPGASQIRTLADMQNLLVEYRLAAEKFRSFIIKNQDINLELYLNPYLFNQTIEENRYNSCAVTDIDGGYTVTCDQSDIALLKVNMADLMVLKQAAAGEIALLSLYTSYSVGSIDELVKKDIRWMSAKDSTESYENVKDAGKLMKNQGLTAVRSLGSDFIVGMKWAIKYQGSLCKTDEYGRKIARKGFLMKDICVENTKETEDSIRGFEMMLAGAVDAKLDIGNGETYQTSVNYLAPLDRPASDLRTLLPATWTADGMNATSFRDKTLAGAFPKADADVLLKNNK